MSRLTITDLQNKVKKQQKLVTISAYTANITQIIDNLVDIILVGDSLGMVIYGFESTLPVNLKLMINHGKAVVDSSKHAFIIIDMPFGSYQVSKEDAFKNASSIIKKTGAGAVKLEGGVELQDTVKHLVEGGIPVIGHIGLLPQHINKMGGYKIQGRDKISCNKIVNDAISLEKAGASAIVVEGVKKEIITQIKKKTALPLIGIGASDKCDGQVLVIDDLLGISDNNAKFVKPYANFRQDMELAVTKYADEVRKEKFPTKEHLYDN